MGKLRLTKRVVDRLIPGGADRLVWDSDLPGFGMRVGSTGAKSYIVQYRVGSGRRSLSRRVTIASAGHVTPEEARRIAKTLLGGVAQGQDPAGDRKRNREAMTVRELAEIFMRDHVVAKRKKGTIETYRFVLKHVIVPEFGSRKVMDVRRMDVAKLHSDLRDRPYMANRVLAMIGTMYSWADRSGLIPEGLNPARRIEKFRENRRERFLNGDELMRLGETLREAETVGLPIAFDTTKPTAKHAPKRPENRKIRLGPHATAAIRLLLFTGARLREILHLCWKDVDLERGLLFLRDSKTGRRTIILNSPALSILTALPRLGDYVIAGHAPDRPRSDLQRPWGAVQRHANLSGVRLHDLRHTHASVGAGAGLGLPIIGETTGTHPGLHDHALRSPRRGSLEKSVRDHRPISGGST